MSEITSPLSSLLLNANKAADNDKRWHCCVYIWPEVDISDIIWQSFSWTRNRGKGRLFSGKKRHAHLAKLYPCASLRHHVIYWRLTDWVVPLVVDTNEIVHCKRRRLLVTHKLFGDTQYILAVRAWVLVHTVEECSKIYWSLNIGCYCRYNSVLLHGCQWKGKLVMW